MPIRNALLLLKVIPHVHSIRNSLQEVGSALSLIVDAPVGVKVKQQPRSIKAQQMNRLGNMRLGINSVNVGLFRDAEKELYIHIGDIPACEVERFLPGNASHRIVVALTDIFLGADKEFEIGMILRCGYTFTRDTDAKGRPTTGVRGGDIRVVLESGKESPILSQMLLDTVPAVKGSIELLAGEDEACIRRIAFEEAYVHSHSEVLQTHSSSPMMLEISISPIRLDVNERVRLDRRWPETSGFYWQEEKEEEKRYAKNETVEKKKSYDEQIQVLDDFGEPIPDYLYYIEFDEKMIASGRTNNQGLTERFGNTSSPQNYVIYWGEEALAKIEEHFKK